MESRGFYTGFYLIITIWSSAESGSLKIVRFSLISLSLHFPTLVSLSLSLHLARSLDQWARARATTINQSLSAICLPQQPITVARQLPHDKWIEEGWNGPACGLVCGGWGVHFIWSSPGCRQQHLQMTPDAD